MSLQNTLDGRKEVQKRTFTKWMNVYLTRRDPPAEVHDLFRDLQDGRILMTLLEELTGCKLLYRFRPSSHRIFRLNNISKALAFLDDRHVKLLGIDASAVADGVPSVVLRLVWNIILHFQVKEMTGGLRRRLSSSLSSLSTSSDLSDLTDAAKSPKYNGKTIKSLLLWVQRCTAKFGVEVPDFGWSWRNGLAFLALIKSLNPDLVDLRQSLTKDPEENLNQAFRTAHQSLDIPPLLEPQDVTCSYPDEKSIITYVSMFLRHCPDIVQDLSAAATSPHISKFRSLETLADREDAEPVFSSFETSHELLLWKRWARRSSNSSLRNKRKSSSVRQPPSPLDAAVDSPEIHSWLDTSVDRGYSKTNNNEIHFSLSSEEGIYSLTPLDSDEEDAYSYILDLNRDVSKTQAEKQVPRVEEDFFVNSDDCESDVKIHNDLNGNDVSADIDRERTGKLENVELKETAEKELFKTQVEERLDSNHLIEFQPQSNLKLEGENKVMSAITEKEEGNDHKQGVYLTTELLEKRQNGVKWPIKAFVEDLHDSSVEEVENKMQTPNVLIVHQDDEDVSVRKIKNHPFTENLTKDLRGGKDFATKLRLKEAVNDTGPGIGTKKMNSKGSVYVSKTTDQSHGDTSNSKRKYQGAKCNLENSAMTSTSREKRVLGQTLAPSGGLNRIELHVVLFLWVLLYCYMIGREITSS
ncbi:uncharacterized protein [Eucyclogobius newberryi]|uniref:uncharacterized protein clmnb n=1 Tax=Eucyclogobius newberryi TaxID=166745 RepID=UPI003B5BD12D